MLLSTVGRVMNRIILERLKVEGDKRLRDEQAGFRKERSCTDHIGTLRWNSPVYACSTCIVVAALLVVAVVSVVLKKYTKINNLLYLSFRVFNTVVLILDTVKKANKYYKMEQKFVKNPNRLEADQLAIYKAWTNKSRGREEDLKLGPLDFKSSALTTRPRCLRCSSCSTCNT